MANTYSGQENLDLQGLPAFATGKVVCDGSTDITIELGWVPRRVELIVDGTPDSYSIWLSSMPDNDLMEVQAAAVMNTSAGVTPVAGTDPDPAGATATTSATLAGFTVGAGVLAASDVVYWCAWR